MLLARRSVTLHVLSWRLLLLARMLRQIIAAMLLFPACYASLGESRTDAGARISYGTNLFFMVVFSCLRL